MTALTIIRDLLTDARVMRSALPTSSLLTRLLAALDQSSDTGFLGEVLGTFGLLFEIGVCVPACVVIDAWQPPVRVYCRRCWRHPEDRR